MKALYRRLLTPIALGMLFTGICVAEDIPHGPRVPTKMTFEGTSYSAYSGNEKLWDMHADKVQGSQQILTASDVRGILYHHGKPHYYFKSSVAQINLSDNNMTFPNGVFFHSVKKERIWVRYLTWDSKQKKFVGTKGVSLVRLNTHLRGERMIWDKTFQIITLQGHVTADTTP